MNENASLTENFDPPFRVRLFLIAPFEIRPRHVIPHDLTATKFSKLALFSLLIHIVSQQL